MTDKMIRRFRTEGVIADDSLLPQSYSTHKKYLTVAMKDEGFLPLLDISPVWRITENNGKYEFELTIQGVYVGMEDAWQHDGILGTRMIPSTQNNKSNPSSRPAE